ncbi:hypothetical protein DBV15_06799 [Temnothorax longispinosus]|uniref:Uncharacterized protein n=1 Tax=Temnothorax longispinosus TaxID=300112 RepID=A0A4S2KHM3_9HYME|nr:hypothetical protein DBV15_06799 [Temnothorax longispinosus]
MPARALSVSFWSHDRSCITLSIFDHDGTRQVNPDVLRNRAIGRTAPVVNAEEVGSYIKRHDADAGMQAMQRNTGCAYSTGSRGITTGTWILSLSRIA